MAGDAARLSRPGTSWPGLRTAPDIATAILTMQLALEERQPGGLAGFRRREVHAKPEMLGRVIRAREISADLLVAISAPRGPVPTRTSVRTRSGAWSAISCETMPPIENPRTSTVLSPSALMKAMALAPISWKLDGTSPELLETPALLNRITSRATAMPWSPQNPNNPACSGNAG